MKKTLKIIIITFISLIIGLEDIKAEALPKVFLNGNINEMTSKNDERKIKLRYVSNELEFEAYAKIKLQGNSSIAYDKKNYTIKLYEDNKYSDKKNVDIGQNWGEQNKYCLKANWIDKTHSRNIVTSNIMANIQKKYNLFMDSPNNGEIDGFPVEVYIDNIFYGLYTWNIPKDNWTFNMDNSNPNHIVMAANEQNNSTLFKEEATLSNWEIEVGIETEETIDKFNRLINFIKNSSNSEFKNNFNDYLNLDATLNYYILTTFAKLSDNISKNLLIATYDGKIWYPVLYDLDTSWGTNWKGTSTTYYKQNLTKNFNNSLLWSKFEKNFEKEIANRYFELRKSILTKNNIINEFNNFYETIPQETLTKEKNKWGSIPGYKINQIEDFLDERIPLIDEKMYELYDVNPQINIEYSTQKPTLKPVTVTLTPNRNDIIIVKNGKKSYDYTYTFKENGKYTFEYQDWYGNNLGTIIIEINCIKTKILINICTSLLIIIIGALLYISSKKNKQKKNNTKEKTTNKKNDTNKKKNSKSKSKTNNSKKSPKQKNTNNTT